MIDQSTISDPENNVLDYTWDTSALPFGVATQLSTFEMKISPLISTVAGTYVVKFRATE